MYVEGLMIFSSLTYDVVYFFAVKKGGISSFLNNEVKIYPFPQRDTLEQWIRICKNKTFHWNAVTWN